MLHLALLLLNTPQKIKLPIPIFPLSSQQKSETQRALLDNKNEWLFAMVSNLEFWKDEDLFCPVPNDILKLYFLQGIVKTVTTATAFAVTISWRLIVVK